MLFEKEANSKKKRTRKNFLTRGQELGIMSPSRMGQVTNLISFSLTEKRNGAQKVLDIQFKFEYNESIKSEEWFLAHHP